MSSRYTTRARRTAAHTSSWRTPRGEAAPAATHIRSLGPALYELRTGRAPYECASLAELAAQQTGGVITPLRDLEPSVPEPFEAAAMHALAREPRFRPASAADFAHELSAASQLPTEPLIATAVTEPLHSRIYQSVTGSSAWLWIAGAAVVAIVAVILGLFS